MKNCKTLIFLMRNYRAGLVKWQTADPMGYPDGWNRLAQHTRGDVSESYTYDHFGRLVEKRENGLTTTFTYDAWGNRLSRVTKNRAGAVVSKETRTYDRLGRLAATTAGFGSQVTYAYDSKGRLVRQTVDGTPIDYAYTKYGQLAGKYLGGKAKPAQKWSDSCFSSSLTKSSFCGRYLVWLTGTAMRYMLCPSARCTGRIADERLLPWNTCPTRWCGGRSALRTPTTPPPRSARCSRSAGDGAADGGGPGGSRASRCA